MVEHGLSDEQREQLIRKSQDMCKLSYCPYSTFPVGAALLCTDGTIFTGCNVENASYGLSICAERVAITKAVSEGRREFAAIAISASKSIDEYISPCGACRQMLVEVVLCKASGEHKTQLSGDLLPGCFTPANLHTAIKNGKH